jgi:hypothetical protein
MQLHQNRKLFQKIPLHNKKYMSYELDENGKEHMWQAVSIAQRTDGA